MMEFFIRKGSVNPVLQMELIEDGRYDFHKSVINDALQDSIVTFSMKEVESGLLKISNAKADIVPIDKESCGENYLLQYKWAKRDTAKPGIYEGWFEVKFNGDIRQYGVVFPEGNLIVPIQEKLIINIV